MLNNETVPHLRTKPKRQKFSTVTRESVSSETYLRASQNPRHLVSLFKFNSEQVSESRQTILLNVATALKNKTNWRGRFLKIPHEGREDYRKFKSRRYKVLLAILRPWSHCSLVCPSDIRSQPRPLRGKAPSNSW